MASYIFKPRKGEIGVCSGLSVSLQEKMHFLIDLNNELYRIRFCQIQTNFSARAED